MIISKKQADPLSYSLNRRCYGMASIQKVNGKWRYRVSYKEGGKYRTKTKGGFRTKKECEMAAAELEKKLEHGYDINAGDQLFSEYMRNWFEVFRKGKNSFDNDADIRRAVEFVEEYFEGVRLKDITRMMYQETLNKYGETRSTASVRKHHTYMRACLREALSDGVIYRDPTFNVVAKGKIESKDEKLKFLNYEEVKKLTEVTNNGLRFRYISRYIILFAIATGARFSEINGLTWNCVDFEDKTVTINKTWDEKYTKDFSNTKNYASNRTITIDEKTLKMLERLKKYQKKQALKTGLRNEKNLVFINSKFELVSNAAVNKTLRNLCKKAGIKEITCHGLRHTHASMLLYEGVNIKYVSRRLGHSDIVTTLQTYSHIMDEMEQKESRVVDETIRKLYG